MVCQVCGLASTQSLDVSMPLPLSRLIPDVFIWLLDLLLECAGDCWGL